MKRELILNRLTKAVDGALIPDLPLFPDFPFSSDLTGTFMNALEAVQGIVLTGFSSDERIKAFQRILTLTEITRICWESSAILDDFEIPYSWSCDSTKNSPVTSHHVQGKFSAPLKIDVQPCNRSSLADIPLSVSEGLWAIAETGSVFESTGPGKSRILPILAPVHVVLLRRSRILATQGDFFQLPELGKTGSTQIVMTGPSRTADIEKVLALGVHGPKKLFVILS